MEPLRDLNDLRHTHATFALRAGVPVFALSRFMGTSIAMIDYHSGRTPRVLCSRSAAQRYGGCCPLPTTRFGRRERWSDQRRARHVTLTM
jgi:hypothetical protein